MRKVLQFQSVNGVFFQYLSLGYLSYKENKKCLNLSLKLVPWVFEKLIYHFNSGYELGFAFTILFTVLLKQQIKKGLHASKLTMALWLSSWVAIPSLMSRSTPLGHGQLKMSIFHQVNSLVVSRTLQQILLSKIWFFFNIFKPVSNIF